ncbi:MAG: hypothetical protein ACK5P1_05055, partial [Sphingobacteriia bacterium]
AVPNWTSVSRNLCGLIGQGCVRFRIWMHYAWLPAGVDAEFAVDNFEIFEQGPDFSVNAILAPQNTAAGTCSYSAGTTARVRIFNNGCSPVGSIPVTLRINGPNGLQSITEVVSTSVNPSATLDYDFAGLVDLGASGAYTLTAFTDFTTESNRSNDTSRLSLNVSVPFVDNYPYTADFNSGSLGWVAANASGTGTNTWVQSSSLPANYAGFSGVDASQGGAWYTSMVANQSNSPALYSPIFDLNGTTNPILSFDYKMQIGNILNCCWGSRVIVEYQLNGTSSWTTLGSNTDPDASWYSAAPSGWTTGWGSPGLSGPGLTTTRSSWQQARMPLCNLTAASCVQFRIWAHVAWIPTGVPAQFAVDNFRISDSPLDATITNIRGCLNSTYDMDITLGNRTPCPGSANITSAQVTVEIDGVPQTRNVTGLNIAPGANQVVSLSGFSIPNGGSTVRAWIKMPNGLVDEYTPNDLAVANLATFPNCNDHCSNPIQLSVGVTQATQTNFGSADPTEDASFSSCSGGGTTIQQSVWYTFTTNSTGGELTIDVTSIVTDPPNSGIQFELMQVTGASACSPSDRTTLSCFNQSDNTNIAIGPNTYPPNTTYVMMFDSRAVNTTNFEITLTGPAVDPLDPGEIAASQTICLGQDPAVFTSVAPAADGNPPYVYQWQDSLAGSGVWNDIAGATGLTYDPAAPSVQEQRFFRRRVIDNNGAGTAAFTNKVELNSTTIAQPGALSATTPACTSTSISAAGSPATGVSWYWQTSATGTETTRAYTAPRLVTASGTYS